MEIGRRPGCTPPGRPQGIRADQVVNSSFPQFLFMSSLHQRAKDVFLVALGQVGEDRNAFLAEACGDDTALRQEVESLLHFHDTTGTDAASGSLDAARFAPGDMFAGRY